jgi:hypothetical protein
MKNKASVILLCLAGFGWNQIAFADFKYTESTKVTGGMIAGLMKFAGAFSKKADEPAVSTVYVKGNRFRRDSSTGSSEIIDLDGRRMIMIDTQKRTYSVATFEQMRQAAQLAQQRMQEKMREKGQDPQLQNAQLNVTPKVEMNPTGNTREILGAPAKEVKMKVEMQMQVQDKSNASQAQSASGSMTVTSDVWVASSGTGYHEVREFYKRMAKEISWMSMPTGALRIDPRAARGMEELGKNSSQMEGLPMLQYVSMYMGGMQAPSGTATGTQAAPAREESASSSPGASADIPVTANQAAAKALSSALGNFGGFGRRKKKQQAEQNSSDASGAGSSASSGAPPSNPGSFMDLTSEVTSFSSESLDSGLFEVPAGYLLVQENPEKLVESNKQ